MSSQTPNKKYKKQNKMKKRQKRSLGIYGLVSYDRVLQPLNNNNQVYKFAQWIQDSTIAQAALTPSFLVFNFQLAQLDQYTSYTAVFDQYRITKASVQFRPMYTAQPLTTTLTTFVPLIYTVVDYDDNNSPGTIAVMREYQNCNIHEYETFTHEFVPHMALAAYSGAFSSYANRAKQWIDCASATVQHYGLKCGVTPGFSGQTNLQIWNVSARLEVEFRNVR